MYNQEFIEKLQKYTPFNEQETVDKEAMITFLERNEDAFLRTNLIGHMTSSSWIVNKDHTKVLMAYHNIYQSFSWTGGHNDGDKDCLEVAKREANEETGIENLKLLSEDIYSIEIIHVNAHIKRGKYVSDHLHLNVTYLFEADDSLSIRNKPDENKEVRWLDINTLRDFVNEKEMYDRIYSKLIEKLKLRDQK